MSMAGCNRSQFTAITARKLLVVADMCPVDVAFSNPPNVYIQLENKNFIPQVSQKYPQSWLGLIKN